MKTKQLFTLIFLTVINVVNAQENFSDLTSQAHQIIKKEDSTQYQKAYDLIEEAFINFPDSINGTALYDASLLNSKMKNKDKAFQYLTPLAKMEKDDEGYPGWSFVLDEYALDDYENLIDDPRWENLRREVRKDSVHFFQTLKQREQEFFSTAGFEIDKSSKGEKLYKFIQNINPYQTKEHRDYSLLLPINDSTETSYLVHLPQNYDPKNKYTVLFFLHGGVRYGYLREYQIPEVTLGGWNRFYTKYCDLNNVILVVPTSSKKYNWMTSDDGFFMIPKIVRTIKQSINIDDNKVFIAGHSNGATGTFSYLMKEPTMFAGFYGFNTHPKVYTGGTFIENTSNRSFINFSTDEDYYYPPNANDKLDSIMKDMGVDYVDYRYNGYPHWFPALDESEPAYQILFEDLKTKKRNPFPSKISWEFDDDNYGAVDWLTDIKLDTLKAQKDWQKQVNFTITKWLKYDKSENLVSEDVKFQAFDYPRKSGKIIADFKDNTFHIQASHIKSFTVNISPEMIDLKRKVKVYVNGDLQFEGKVKYDNDFMKEDFIKNRDRVQVWVNQIKVGVSERTVLN